MHRIRACGWIDISIFLSSCTDWLCTSTLLLGDRYRHHRVSIVSLLRLSRCLSLHHHHRPNDRPNEERKKKRVIWSKSYKFFEFQTTTRRFFWKLRDSYYRRRRSSPSPLMSTTAPASLSTMSLETRQSKITITEVKSGGWRSTQR